MTDPLDPSKPRYEAVQPMPKTERELRVMGTPSYQFADKDDWKEGRVVFLECDEEGNCGGLEGWMVEYMRQGESNVPERFRDENGWIQYGDVEEHIASAIAGILKEAQGGE